MFCASVEKTGAKACVGAAMRATTWSLLLLALLSRAPNGFAAAASSHDPVTVPCESFNSGDGESFW